MMCFKSNILIFVLLFLFEPICINLSVSAIGWNTLDSIKKYTWCQLKECCNEDYVQGDFFKLKANLEEKLYGQHLVLEIVINALQAHWGDKQPPKALTLSFHGWPGSGKNYVTKFIKEALYKEGTKSRFVHHFIGRIHFPLEDKVDEYKSNLQNYLKGNVSNCGKSLFIFDEVDKMPPNILNAIKPMIDYHDLVDGVDYRRAIFIFLSNTGSTMIKDHFLYLWKKGLKRKDIQLKDFEALITKGAFNEKGGFHHSDTIKSNLIDHYVPFFPMQQEHVEMCIKDQFVQRGLINPERKMIEEVLYYLEWGPSPENLFSTTGCKRISSKVALVIQKSHQTRKTEL